MMLHIGIILVLAGHWLQTLLYKVCGDGGCPTQLTQLVANVAVIVGFCRFDCGHCGDLIGESTVINLLENLPTLCRALVLLVLCRALVLWWVQML